MTLFSSGRSQLCEALTTFSMTHPERQQTAEEIRRFIQQTPDGFSRHCHRGHMTGSAWLVHPAGDRVLLTLHHKLQRWLQPGGHADGETDMLHVALREAEEESGITHIVPLQTDIFDLDIHTIPARPFAGEEEHQHYDIRYLLQAKDEEVHLSPESDDLRWWSAGEILAHRELFDDSVLRMAHLWMKHSQRHSATAEAGERDSSSAHSVDKATSPGYAAGMTSPAEKQALDFFHRGYSCAQSVLAPFAEALGMNETAALRLASGFGAGVGRMRGTCGAFSSLVMVAGFCRGNTSGDAGEKEKIYTFIRELAERFREEFGTLNCRELLQLQESPPEGARPHDRTAAYYATRPCERCVAFCAQLAQEVLREQFSGQC